MNIQIYGVHQVVITGKGEFYVPDIPGQGNLSDVTKELFVRCTRFCSDTPDMARRLIDDGADVNFRCGPLEILKNGIHYISDLNECVTPLRLACQQGNIRMVRLLVERGAHRDDRALYCATEECRFPDDLRPTKALRDGKVEVARFLLEVGFGGVRFRVRGRTPLFHAIRDRSVAMIRLLLERGARVNGTEDCPCEPLVLVCHMEPSDLEVEQFADDASPADMARLLLESDADPDVCSEDGSSMMEVAARTENDVADVLLAHQLHFLPSYDDDE